MRSLRDPAPSRLRYKANRLWLTPGFRKLMQIGESYLQKAAHV